MAKGERTHLKDGHFRHRLFEALVGPGVTDNDAYSAGQEQKHTDDRQNSTDVQPRPRHWRRRKKIPEGGKGCYKVEKWIVLRLRLRL